MDAATNDDLEPVPTEPSHRLLGSSEDPKSPLIICFHGSGESCEPSCRPKQPLSSCTFLKTRDLPGPYILVGHSYGGAFARMFIHKAAKDVAGAVLVETGQEGGLDPKIAAAQTRNRVFGDKPLSVIRGNSFLEKTKSLKASEKMAVTDQQKAALNVQWQLLQASDAEDERMKKTQLLLSKNSRYIHIPNCGHNVIRDRPVIVAEEVDWVLGNVTASHKCTWWRTLVIKLESMLH
ncbi:Alpha/Beta hydrolase protein [Apiospora arundinis]